MRTKSNAIAIQLFNNYHPVKALDYTNEIYEKIHNELFQNAIISYFNAYNTNKPSEEQINIDDYKIIDLMDDIDMTSPSSALLISKRKKIKPIKVDLNNYWNINYNNDHEFNKHLMSELLITQENKTSGSIDYVNYVEGEVTIKNKFNNAKTKISFDKIDFVPVVQSQLNTFGSELYDE